MLANHIFFKCLIYKILNNSYSSKAKKEESDENIGRGYE